MNGATAAPRPWLRASDANLSVAVDDGLTPAGRWALALLGIDPVALGGIVLRGPAGPWRDQWLAALRAGLPADAAWIRMPHHANESALLGGLDLPATLHAGRPMVFTGLLARADGGVLLMPMAERTSPMSTALVCGALDTRQIHLQRDGQHTTWPCHWTLVALDESREEDEVLPAALRDRVALEISPEDGAEVELPPVPASHPEGWVQARARLSQVTLPADLIQALAGTAESWGVSSLRALLFAARVARMVAAMEGFEAVRPQHAELAAMLVLAPRATRWPTPPMADERLEPAPTDSAPAQADEPATPSEPEPGGSDEPPDGDTASDGAAQPLQERLVEAVRVGLPADLLARLQSEGAVGQRSRGSGRFGASLDHATRGRVVGSRPGRPGGGARLHLIDTLRAAAPWQRLRRGPATEGGSDEARRAPVKVHPEDLRMARRRQHRPGTTVFLVDASGSSALHRMAEAKGAVELLLAQCYVRRDQVAVLAFRGTGAQLLLPPTRSLVRAKRQLAALPGGGGTPLASGLEAARALCQQIGRRGDAPTLVLLTDGRANIAADGGPGRERATADAQAAALRIAELGLAALLIDTSPQASEAAHALARTMHARYLPLPHAGASGLCEAVLQALPRATT